MFRVQGSGQGLGLRAYSIHLAQDLDGGGHLLFANLLIFLLFGRRLEPLPRQAPAQKVH